MCPFTQQQERKSLRICKRAIDCDCRLDGRVSTVMHLMCVGTDKATRIKAIMEAIVTKLTLAGKRYCARHLVRNVGNNRACREKERGVITVRDNNLHASRRHYHYHI